MPSHTISAVLTLSGLVGLLGAFVLAQQMRVMLGTGSMKKAWDILTIFIVIFIGGYTWYLVQLMTGREILSPTLLASLVFFFGSFFVFSTVYLNKEALGGGT